MDSVIIHAIRKSADKHAAIVALPPVLRVVISQAPAMTAGEVAPQFFEACAELPIMPPSCDIRAHNVRKFRRKPGNARPGVWRIPCHRPRISLRTRRRPVWQKRCLCSSARRQSDMPPRSRCRARCRPSSWSRPVRRDRRQGNGSRQWRSHYSC